MTVKGKTGGIGTSAIHTDAPYDDGLELGKTKLKDEPNLEIEEEDLVTESEVGL